MTAQTRYGRATVEAAHALDRVPVTPRLTLGTAIGYLLGGLALVAVAWLFALFAAVL